MDQSGPQGQPGADQQAFVPFTKAERIQQAGQIDKDIVSLLSFAGQAVESLRDKESSAKAKDGEMDTTGDGADRTEVFKTSMDDFMRTLRSVNVGMRRQIWGLEEERIVTLRGADGSSDAPGVGDTPTPLEPDGNGNIGDIDVGWLNSRSNQVDRQMEGELWKQTEKLLEQMLQESDNTDINAMST